MRASFTSDEIEAGRKFFARPTRFIKGVAALDQLTETQGVEIAFAGRSNVGKSSLINALTGIKGLARASNTPGRTRELNYFEAGDRLILVDMPGYGFAKASRKEVKSWQAVMRGYLRGRPNLTRAFVLIDARHGILGADRDMFDLLDEAAVAFQFILTKADKLTSREVDEVAMSLSEEGLKRAAALQSFHVTSAKEGGGIAELRAELARLVDA